MGNALWPLFLLIGSNLIYQTCAKCSSKEADPFAILTMVYLIATIGCFAFFLILSHAGGQGISHSIVSNLRAFNWANYLLGLAIIGLEAGFLYLYRCGWDVSVGPICSYTGVAIGLMFLGFLAFEEHITYRQIFGVLLCLGGIALISLKK